MINIWNCTFLIDPSYNDAVSDEETDDEDSMDEPLSGHLSQNETKLTREEHQSEGQPSETEEWEDEDDRFDSDDDDDDEQVQSYPTSKSSTASGRKGISSFRFTFNSLDIHLNLKTSVSKVL